MTRRRPFWVEDQATVVAHPETTQLRIIPGRIVMRTNGGWMPVRLRDDGCFDLDQGDLPNRGPEFKLLPGRIDFLAARPDSPWDGVRNRGEFTLSSASTRVQLPSDSTEWQANQVSTAVSLRLLEQAGRAARGTQRRLASTFTIYVAMLGVTFVVGIAGFAVALYNTLVLHSGTVPTVVFGGLSAVSFVTFFLVGPSKGINQLGPRTAWLLAMVNSYWTKLAYLNDAKVMVKGLNEAETSLTEGILTYLKHESADTGAFSDSYVEQSQRKLDEAAAQVRKATASAANSAKKAPSKPAKKAPSKPAAKAPSKPAAKAPSKPAAKAPSKPAQKAPSTTGTATVYPMTQQRNASPDIDEPIEPDHKEAPTR